MVKHLDKESSPQLTFQTTFSVDIMTLWHICLKLAKYLVIMGWCWYAEQGDGDDIISLPND